MIRTSLLTLAVLLCCTACRSTTPVVRVVQPIVYIGNGAGNADEPLRAYRLNPSTGALTLQNETPGLLGPNYVATSPDGQRLYSVSSAPEGGQGVVSAFIRNTDTQALTLLNQQPTMGNGPCYVAVDAEGEWVMVANYSSGNVALYPLTETGALKPASDVQQHSGSSIDTDRQNGPHAHYIDVDPSNRFALVNNLGTDEIWVYALNKQDGTLDSVHTAQAVPGSGPRHLAFDYRGSVAYVLNELTATITAYRFAANGAMTPFQTLPIVPEDADGFNKSADIHVHPSGRFLYASNRGDFDSIAAYRINRDGTLIPLHHTTEGIVWPRNFAIDPTGQIMLVANRRADTVTSYRIDPNTGELTLLRTTDGIAQPVVVKFAP
ncbi:MAG: lactonase family protein [Bacteroidota bacterium]